MSRRHNLFVSTALSTAFLFAGPVAVMAQSGNWTGFYAGGGAAILTGGHTGSTDIFLDQALSDFPAGDINEHIPDMPGAPRGAAVYGDAGYDMQVDTFLYGVEASILKGAIGGVSSFSTSTFTEFTTTSDSLSFNPTSTEFFTTEDSEFSTFVHVITGPVTDGTTGSTVYTDTTSYTGMSSTVGFDNSTTFFAVGTSVLSTVITETTDSSTFYDTITNTVTYSFPVESSVTVTGRASIDWLATFQGRAGYVMDRTLFYGTAGIALGQISQQFTTTYSNPYDDDVGTTSGTSTQTRVGGVIGIGMEHLITDHMSIKLEGDYFNLGTASYSIKSPGGDFTATGTQVIDGFLVKGGIEYRF